MLEQVDDALGFGEVRQARLPPLAWESLASSVPSGYPRPPLDTLKKLRRVIAWSPPRLTKAGLDRSVGRELALIQAGIARASP
jgi:hypothetical protein